MNEEKPDYKKAWRDKNRDRLNQYQRGLYRRKQAQKGLVCAELKTRTQPDVISDRQRVAICNMILCNAGLTKNDCIELSKRYAVKV